MEPKWSQDGIKGVPKRSPKIHLKNCREKCGSWSQNGPILGAKFGQKVVKKGVQKKIGKKMKKGNGNGVGRRQRRTPRGEQFQQDILHIVS